MSYVIAVPDTLAAAAADVASIGSSINAAHSAAAAPTTAVVAAAGDEVSAAISSLFSGYGKEFQALSARAAEVHAQFVQALNGAGGAYAAAEAAGATPLQAAQAMVKSAQFYRGAARPVRQRCRWDSGQPEWPERWDHIRQRRQRL